MFIEPHQAPDTDPQSTDGEIIEIAQAATPAGEPIGQISAFQGAVFITHPDGTKVPAADGLPIFQGDAIETGTGGALGITFADDSTFSLAENGSMVIDEMVYDPGTQAGKSAISVAEGVFTFVSGQIAKTEVEAMTITTPVAIIGIRGTAGGGKAGPEGTPNTFTMFQDPGGTVGEMVIKTLGGTQVMNAANQTSVISSAYVPPSIPVTLPLAVLKSFYAKAAAFGPKDVFQGPAETGPEPDTAPAEGDADAVIAAAIDDAAEAEIQAALAADPLAFGTSGAIEGVLDFLVVTLSGDTGLLDPFNAFNFGESTFDGGDFFGGDFFDHNGDDFLFGGDDDDFFDGDDHDDFFDFDFFDFDFFFFDDDHDDDLFFEEDFFFLEFDPVVFGDEKFATSGNDILIGGTANTEFIYAQDEAAFGGTDTLTDLGGSRDRITFEALDDVAIRVSNTASDSTNFVLFEIDTDISTNVNSTELTSGFTVTNTVNLSRQIEDLQALDSGFFDFDSDGVLLFGATNLTGSEEGYIVAGTSFSETIDLSGFSNNLTSIGSIIFGKGGNDTLTGTVSEDDIFGGDGDDILDGDDGINFVEGGFGNDLLLVTVASSINDLDGDDGDDSLDYSSLSNVTTYTFGTFGSLALIRSGGGADVVFSIESLISGSGDDEFNFNTLSLGFTSIDGGVGDDSFNFNLAGGDIAAIIDGGTGIDTITLNAATDIGGSGGVENVEFINGSSGKDSIDFVSASTVTFGVSPVETITGSNSNDTITLAIVYSTSETINLSGGIDTLNLVNGDNAVKVSDTENINGGTGDDTINLIGSSVQTVTGGQGADFLTDTTINISNTFRYTNTDEGALAGGNSGSDTINGFATGSDRFAIDGTLESLLDDISSPNQSITFGSSAVNLDTTEEAILLTGLSDIDLVTSGFANLLTSLNAALSTASSGADALIVAQSFNNTGFYVYQEDGTTVDTATTSELTLLAIVDNEVVATTDVVVV